MNLTRLIKETQRGLIGSASPDLAARFCLFLALLAIATAPGCSMIKLHRALLQQGNIVTQKMVDKLQPCMSREQVEFVMGRPVVQNTFDVDRWDYVYTFENRDGTRERKSVSLVFEDGALTSIEGSFLPEDVTTEEEFHPREKCEPKLPELDETELLLDSPEGVLDPFMDADADEEPFDDPFTQFEEDGDEESTEVLLDSPDGVLDPFMDVDADEEPVDDPFTQQTLEQDGDEESTEGLRDSPEGVLDPFMDADADEEPVDDPFTQQTLEEDGGEETEAQER